jgi:hypothetical protein
MSQDHEEAEVQAEDAGESHSIPYSIQVDRWLSQEARFVSWCPTMDLVAVAYTDNSVWIHRLSYERLYVLPKDEKTITALDWRPDGASCALQTSHFNQIFKIYGETIYFSTFSFAASQCLSMDLLLQVRAFPAAFFCWASERNLRLLMLNSPFSIGKAIVLGYSDGGKSIWNIENGEKMFALAGAAAADPNTSQSQANMEEDEPIYQFRADDDDDEYGDSMQNSSTNQTAQDASKSTEDTRIHKSSIKGMGWYQDQRASSSMANLTYANRLADVLPPLKHFEDSEDGTALPSHQRHQSLIFASQSNHLNVMLSYDANGDIVLTAHGIFALGRFNAYTLLRETYKEANSWTVRITSWIGLTRVLTTLGVQSATVVDATLSQDLTRLILILRAKNASGAEELLALPVDTSILAIRRKELEQISWQSVLVGDTMNLINSAYERLQKSWENTSSQLNQKLKQFQQMLTGSRFRLVPFPPVSLN